MEVDIVNAQRAYRPTPRETTINAQKALRHRQTCYVCRKKGHYAKECPMKRATTIISRSGPGDQSINNAQPRKWANSRLRTTRTVDISWSKPGYQNNGYNTKKIGQHTNGPLPQTTFLPQSELGYQNNGQYNETQHSDNGYDNEYMAPRQWTTDTLSRSGSGYQSNGNYNGTWHSINGTIRNNTPSTPPSYRTTSRTPSPTLPQSSLGNQNTMEQLRQIDTYTRNNITSQNYPDTAQNMDTIKKPTKFVNINFVTKEI
jgi:Zinc knuckle